MSSISHATQDALGLRLQRRREDFGASLDQLASWSGVDADRLEQIEKGQPMRSWEYEAICRGLAVDPGAMARGGDLSPRRSVARFRSADWVRPKPGDFRILSLAAEMGRIGGYLASQDARPTSVLSDLRAPTPVSDREEPWKEGYRLGEKARRALLPGVGPIKEVESLLTKSGIHVARIPFSSRNLDAASLWEEGALPVILLNERSPRSRSVLSRRALLAHELCHLLHDSGDRDLTTQLSWGENTGNYDHGTEQRARAFAPAFLAPRDEVRHWFRAGSGRRLTTPEAKVEELACRWGFSLRGAVWHAKNCEVISPRTAERLDLELPDQEHSWNDDFEQSREDELVSWEEELGESIAPLAGGLVASLVSQAVAAGSISKRRGQEIVTWA